MFLILVFAALFMCFVWRLDGILVFGDEKTKKEKELYDRKRNV